MLKILSLFVAFNSSGDIMKFMLCLCVLFSSLAMAGFNDEKAKIGEFCTSHGNDPKKVVKSAGGLGKLTPEYVKLLEKNEKELNYLMVCNLNRYFWQKFPKTHQAAFEKKAGKKFSMADLDKVSDQFLETVFNDKPANRLAAFNAGEMGVEKYYDQKIGEFVKKNK
ncbi:MAG: hypothetical protein ACK5XN_04765 [Bacteroidota bacterium]